MILFSASGVDSVILGQGAVSLGFEGGRYNRGRGTKFLICDRAPRNVTAHSRWLLLQNVFLFKFLVFVLCVCVCARARARKSECGRADVEQSTHFEDVTQPSWRHCKRPRRGVLTSHLWVFLAMLLDPGSWPLVVQWVDPRSVFRAKVTLTSSTCVYVLIIASRMSHAFSDSEYCSAFHGGSTSVHRKRALDRWNVLKQEIHVDNIQRFISYMTENTVRLHCKHQSILFRYHEL
jgi:hypothetical protein